MNLNDIYKSLRMSTKQNSPLILTVAASVGTLATAYFTARATFKAAAVIQKHDNWEPHASGGKEQLIERTKLVWKFYIPPVISGASTIAFIVGANRVATNRVVAATTAFTVVEQALEDYRDKVVEVHGKNKEQAIRDSIAEDKVKATAPSSDVMLVGGGHVLCMELYTGRPFYSEMESLLRAQNTVNAKLYSHPYATLSDFYYEVGLPPTTVSGNLGWHDGKEMKLEISTVLTEDGRPCLAFDYNYVDPL